MNVTQPTDDEREALWEVLSGINFKTWHRNEVIDEIFAAGFRRPVPPEPSGERHVCAWCPGNARGSAWHNDGMLHPSCGQTGHGQGWVPDENARLEPQGKPSFTGAVTESPIPEACSGMGEPSPIDSKWACGKCAREVAQGNDDGQIPEHHRTCPKRAQGEPSDASTCDHCGGESWHHTVECFTGAPSEVECAVTRLDQCLANREAGVGAWSMVRPEDVRTVLTALRQLAAATEQGGNR